MTTDLILVLLIGGSVAGFLTTVFGLYNNILVRRDLKDIKETIKSLPKGV